MDSKIFLTFGLLGVALVLFFIAVGAPAYFVPYPLKILLLLISLLFDVAAFAARRYSYIMLPLLKQHSKYIVLSNEEPYWLSSSGDSVIKRQKGEYVATAYIMVPFYRSGTEMNEEEKLEYARQMSRLVGVSSDPVRFTTELYLMNKDSYIDELKTAINNAENEEAQLTQGDGKSEQLEIVRGRLTMWRNVLESSSAASSMELITYASISASGTKEYEAVSLVQQKAREVMSGIGSTLGVTPSVVTGREILKFVEPEYLIPFSTISQQMEKKTEEQVI